MPSLDTITGVLLGTALGDAIGLPHEGLGPARIARRLGSTALGHGMVFGRGLLSDDTEHTCMVARALSEADGDLEGFTASLARQLRRWMLSVPPGVGFATARGTLRLLLGVSPDCSGVFSAGNGPAMRSALLGVCARDDGHLVDLVRASTCMTHTDPRALDGAVFVARVARQEAEQALDAAIIEDIGDDAFRERVAQAWSSEADREAFRVEAGFERGVSGFVVHTVPAVVHCVRRHRDASDAIEAAIRLGGDTDTTGAIVGAIVGARHGVGGLPSAWVEGLSDWPLTVPEIHALARSVAEGTPPPRQRWVAAIPRNIAFTLLLFGHIGLRWLGR